MTQLTRVRIHSYVTKTKFLHFEDTLNIGKVRLFAGTYRQGQGMDAHAHHYIDIPDARVIFKAIARAEQNYKYTEYKGTPPSNGGNATSRVLSVAIKDTNVYIELKTGPGRLTGTGAITPFGNPDVTVNVSFKLHDARVLAETVLAYIQAWDVLRIFSNQKTVSKPSPYLLLQNPTALATTISSANAGRPMTSESLAVPTRNADTSRPTTSKSPTTTVITTDLKYQDGTSVDMKNETEVTTFKAFVSANNYSPSSKATLLSFYTESSAEKV